MALSRRAFLASPLLAVPAIAAAPRDPAKEPWGYSLNTSTIRGQGIPITEEVDLAAAAGFSAIEPWMKELETFVASGGSLKDLAKRIADKGLTVESAIGFAEWISDDAGKRAKGLEAAKHDMEMLQTLGAKRIAAPPVGATNQPLTNLNAIADRYRALADLGAKMGIVPQVELWGFSKTLSKLGETVFVAMESAHPQACVLPDVYHLYKGGSDFAGLKLIRGSTIGIFHVNDYPPTIERGKIVDADRVYPGDGGAPLKTVFRTLREIGYAGMLSLELFNKEYWKQEAKLVVTTGLAKMRAAVREALA